MDMRCLMYTAWERAYEDGGPVTLSLHSVPSQQPHVLGPCKVVHSSAELDVPQSCRLQYTGVSAAA